MRIVVGVVSSIITMMMALAGLFVLLVALNGFSERQASSGMSVYAATTAIDVIASCIVGAIVYRIFMVTAKRPRWASALLAIVVVAVLSLIVLIMGLVVSVVITSAK